VRPRPAPMPGAAVACHALGMRQAKLNGDLKRDFKDKSNNGAYHQLPPDRHESLLRFALSIAPEVRKSESAALDRQRKAKKRKQELLHRKRLVASQKEYANALTFIEMYHSRACWKMAAQARKAFSKLGSVLAKKEAVKSRFGSELLALDGRTYIIHGLRLVLTTQVSNYHLINNIIPEQKKRSIPEVPPVNLPSRSVRCQFGTRSKDVEGLEKFREDEKNEIVEGGQKLRDELEEGGVTDRYEKRQGPRPNVDESAARKDTAIFCVKRYTPSVQK